jgi:hypothetical protein
MINSGFEKEEIEKLKNECREEGQSFVFVEDEDEEDFEDDGDFVHFQFVGEYEGKEVIYDTILSTLSLHHNSLLFEEAEKKVMKLYKDYVPYENRPANAKVNEEAEQMIEEFIEEMEDEETIKVAELIEVDPDFEFGIGLEVALNVEEITLEVIEKFISEFNAGTLKLDKTLYSFKNDYED